MRIPFDRRKAEVLAGQIDSGNIVSSEAQVAAHVRGAFRIEVWPEQAVWQRIYAKALGDDARPEPPHPPRFARRLAYAVVGVALAAAVTTGVLLLPGRSRMGSRGPLSSGTAVAHEMLAELTQPGEVTHYVIERQVTGRPGPDVRRIDCWIDGEKGIVKSTGSIPGHFNGRQMEAATRVTTVERGGRATTITQDPNRTEADVGITNNFFVPPASLLSDPMRGGVSRYEQMLRSGELTLVGTETVQGVATYKLRSEFAGVSLFWEASATTIINARQDNFQPVIVTTTLQEEPIGERPWQIRHMPKRIRVVTRYVRAEVLERSSLPATFFDVRIPPRAVVQSEIGYSTEEARRFGAYPVYYAGASLQGMPLQALAELAGPVRIVPGGANRFFIVLYQNRATGVGLFMTSVPGAVDLRQVPELKADASSRLTTVVLTRGALRGRRALFLRHIRGLDRGQADLYVTAPDSTIRISGRAAQVLRAANGLQKLN